MRKNGFLTVYTLWVGLIMVFLASSTCLLSVQFLKQIPYRRQCVQMDYDVQAVLRDCVEEMQGQSMAKKKSFYKRRCGVVRLCIPNMKCREKKCITIRYFSDTPHRDMYPYGFMIRSGIYGVGDPLRCKRKRKRTGPIKRLFYMVCVISGKGEDA